MAMALALARGVVSAQDRPIDGIEDNSFFIEEAYNQEDGVVQHIFTFLYTNDSQHRGWAFSFTDEWPFLSQDHQLSLTIPWTHLRDSGEQQNGIGDILLNYRYQLSKERDYLSAFAPRFSLIVPSGSPDKGTGDGVVGYQWNLPLSKKVSSKVAVHANFGLPICRACACSWICPVTRIHLNDRRFPIILERARSMRSLPVLI